MSVPDCVYQHFSGSGRLHVVYCCSTFEIFPPPNRPISDAVHVSSQPGIFPAGCQWLNWTELRLWGGHYGGQKGGQTQAGHKLFLPPECLIWRRRICGGYPPVRHAPYN